MRSDRMRASFAILFAGLLFTSCTNHTGRQGIVVSPDGLLIADWYVVSQSGALGRTADYVQIRKRGERFTKRTDYVFCGIAADVLKVTWTDGTHLEITYPANTPIDRSMTSWNNVSITYHEDSKLGGVDFESNDREHHVASRIVAGWLWRARNVPLRHGALAG